MPKQVEPLSILRPASEIVTSSRTKIYKAKKHLQKLNDVEMDFCVKMAVLAIERLEQAVKGRLKHESLQRNRIKQVEPKGTV